MRAFARMVVFVASVGLVAQSAFAQGQIQNLRIGKQPQYTRLVFDLGFGDIDAEITVDGNRFELEVDAGAPSLTLSEENQLADLGILVEGTSIGSRVVVALDGRRFRAFRLPGSDDKGDRLVLDVGRGAPTDIPPDSLPVPIRELSDSTPVTPPPPVVPERDPDPEPVVESPPSTSSIDDLLSGGSEPEPEPEPAPAPARAPRTDVAAAKPVERRPQPEPERPRTVASAASTSAAPTGGKPPEEAVWVLVRSIDIEGVGQEPSLDDLRDLQVSVSPVDGGYVAPREDLTKQRLALRALTGDDREGRRLGGSVLQLIVETIAAAYSQNDKLGTRVDIRRQDLEQLMSDSGDGRLVIRVREPAPGT